MTTLLRPTSYVLRKVSIDSPRFPEDNQGRAIDVTAIVGEINIFESIYSPYIIGDIMIVDTEGWSNVIQFIGQETLTISFFVDQDAELTREFIIYNVEKQEKLTNAASSVYILSFIEKHGYFSYFQKISKYYSGNLSDIIYSVISDELFDQTETDIDRILLNENNFEKCNKSASVICPNISPLAFCMMLLEEVTTEYGEPFFLFSTLKEGIQLKSLNSLINSENSIINPNRPYIYSQMYTDTSFLNEAYRIFTMEVKNQDNTIELARQGAFGTEEIIIDPFYKSGSFNIYRGKFNQKEYFETKKRNGRYLNQDNLYDSNFFVGPEQRPLDQLKSEINISIATGGMFDQNKSLSEYDSIEEHILKQKRISDLLFLQKQQMDIIIPGWSMMNKKENTSVGKMIKVKIPMDTIHVSNPDERNDTKKSGSNSGLYLITSCRHKLNVDSQYVCALEVAKIGKEK